MDRSAITDCVKKASEAQSGQEKTEPWSSLSFLAWNIKDRQKESVYQSKQKALWRLPWGWCGRNAANTQDNADTRSTERIRWNLTITFWISMSERTTVPCTETQGRKWVHDLRGTPKKSPPRQEKERDKLLGKEQDQGLVPKVSGLGFSVECWLFKLQPQIRSLREGW